MADRITTTAELTWNYGLRFAATTGESELVIDGDSSEGPSPMQTLAVSLAGCMAIDMVDIIKKGRHDFRGLHLTFTGLRAPEPPKRYEEITIHFVIEGNVPAAAIDRAISLSREKYCSVWHSMRQDITLTTTYEVRL